MLFRSGVDEPAVVRLRLFDASLVNDEQRRVEVSLRKRVGQTWTPAGSLTLLRQSTAEASEPSQSSGSARFSMVWRPSEAGRYALAVSDALLDELALRRQVEVVSADDERRQPQADHQRLATLAEGSGGRVVPPASLSQLETLLPNRKRVSINSRVEPLWNAPIWFALFLVLVSIEWAGRKLIRLA